MPRPIRADEEAPLPALRDRVEGPAERIKTGGRRTTGRTRGGSPALLRPFGQQFNTVAALLPLPSAPGQQHAENHPDTGGDQEGRGRLVSRVLDHLFGGAAPFLCPRTRPPYRASCPHRP